jgi:hypothetical protein
MDRMMQLLIVDDPVTGPICEWIAKYIDRPLAGVKQKHGARVGDGEIWVSAEVMEEFWTAYFPHWRGVVNATKIGRGLNKISYPKDRLHFTAGGKTFRRWLHPVKPDLILAWAAENLSCDRDDFRAKVYGPVL